jgi:hypothetical protein
MSFLARVKVNLWGMFFAGRGGVGVVFDER